MHTLTKSVLISALFLLLLTGAAWAGPQWAPQVETGEKGADFWIWEQLGSGERLPLEALCDGRIASDDVAWNVAVGDFDGDGRETPAAVILETCEIVAPEDVYAGGVRLPSACTLRGSGFAPSKGGSCERSSSQLMTQARDTSFSEVAGTQTDRLGLNFCITTQLACWPVLILDCNAGGACNWNTVTACQYRRCCPGLDLVFDNCTEYVVWE